MGRHKLDGYREVRATRQRRSPYRHTVHTKDPRYAVPQYGRGFGDPPPHLPRTDSRSAWGMGLETREGVTKTRHAWQVDDALSPGPKRVYGEKNPDWMIRHNRRDVLSIDHPSNRDFVLKMLREDEQKQQRYLDRLVRRQQTVQRIVDKKGSPSPAESRELERLAKQTAKTREKRDDFRERIRDRMNGRSVRLPLRLQGKRLRAVPLATQALPTSRNPDQLVGHTSAETAYIKEDYPYGRNIRTKMRMWVETKAKIGQRIVTQTLNPRTNRWNAPKPSTYSPVVLLVKEKQPDGRVFVKPLHLDVHIGTTIDEILGWKDKYSLDKFQSEMVDRMAVAKNAQKYIQVTVKSSGPLDLSDPEDMKKLEKISEEQATSKEEEAKVIESAIRVSRSELRNKDLI